MKTAKLGEELGNDGRESAKEMYGNKIIPEERSKTQDQTRGRVETAKYLPQKKDRGGRPPRDKKATMGLSKLFEVEETARSPSK